MAIQVSGTTVVSDARALTNIASVDATTSNSINAAGVGAIDISVTATGSIVSGEPVFLNLSNQYVGRAANSGSITSAWTAVGIAQASYSNGQTALVRIVGDSATNGSGFVAGKTYYVTGAGFIINTGNINGTQTIGKASTSTRIIVGVA